MKWLDRYSNALAPLSWGFDEGDDGDPIALALDQADSLLRLLPRCRTSKANTLPGLLAELGFEQDESLADLVRQSAFYDGGMSASQARRVSLMAEDVSALLLRAGALARRTPAAEGKLKRSRRPKAKNIGGRRGE